MPNEHASAQLDREVQELRRLVDDLRASFGARQELNVRVLERHRFLGQPVTIVATVSAGPERTPIAHAPVTFATTWGALSPAELNAPPRGTTVTARTTTAGTATVKLLPPFSPDLLAPQQDQLIQALDLLDPTAATPHDLELGLSWLANIYRWETNVDLRRAIDIAVRDLRPDLLDGINEREELDDWAYVESLVTVYVPAETGGAIQSAAVTPVRCKDWLGPWVQTYRRLSDAATRLPDNLTWLAVGQETPARVSDRVYERVRAHLVDQPGLIGERTGRAIAERVIRTFLYTGAAELPPTTQAALFKSLLETTSSVTEGAAVLSAVGTIRADVREDVAGKADVADLTSLAESVNDTLGAKVDLGMFEGFRTEATAALETKVNVSALDSALATKIDQAAFDTALANKVDTSAFDSALAAKVDTRAFDEFHQETGVALNNRATIGMLEDAVRDKVDGSVFDTRLAQKADLSVVEEELAAKIGRDDFQEALATKVDTDMLDRRLAEKVDTDALTNALAGMVDTATLNDRLSTKIDAADFEGAMRGKVDVVAFDRFRDEIRETSDHFVTGERLDEALRTFLDASVLDDRFATKADLNLIAAGLATKVDVDTFERGLTRKVDTATFDQRLATKVDATTLDQRLAAKVDATTFDQRLAEKVDTTMFTTSLAGKIDRTTFQTALATKVDRAAFNTTVAGLRTDVTGMRTRINNIDNR